MLGRFDEAWPLARNASQRLLELTGEDAGEVALAEIAVLMGDHDAASRYLRIYCDRLEEQGQRGLLSTYAPALGRSLCALGRHDEAEPLAQLGRELSAEHDIHSQMLWRQVLALVHAYRSEHCKGVQIAREAVALSEGTDDITSGCDALRDLAEVLEAAGRRDEATDALVQVIERYEHKKNIAMAVQVRARLLELLT